MDLATIQKIVQKVVEQQHVTRSVKSVSIFGSAARGEMNQKSDIDLIIEFEQPVSLFDFIGVKLDFEDALKRKVDLLTPKSVHPLLKEEIFNSAKKIYEK